MQPYEEIIVTIRSDQINPSQRKAAFGLLVEQFQERTIGWAFQALHDIQTAQDVAQETFLTAYQKLDQLCEPGAFPGWLRTIVRTHCNRIQRRKTHQTSPIDMGLEALSTEPDPAEIIEGIDLKQTVLAAIEALPEHEQSVVKLFYLDDYSIQEIADLLALPITTIKKRLQYARDRLRRRFAQSVTTIGTKYDELRNVGNDTLLGFMRLFVHIQPEPCLSYCYVWDSHFLASQRQRFRPNRIS